MSNPRATFAQAEILLRAVEREGERGLTTPEREHNLPDLPVARALAAAIRSTLEVMFFVDVVPEAPETRSTGEPKPPAEWLWVEVGFQGTRSGRMLLGLEKELAAYCHEGFQPEDSGLDFGESGDYGEPAGFGVSMDGFGEAPAGPCMEHSVLELGNIVCGSFLSNAWPDGLFRVEEPLLRGAGAAPQRNSDGTDFWPVVASWPLAASCVCHTTEGSVQAKVYTKSDGQ